MTYRHLGVLLSALLATGAAMNSGSAQARDYTLMIYETPQDFALRADTGEVGRAYWAGYAALGAALAKAGVMKGGTALDAEEDTQAGADALILSGYFIIDVADMASARAWAEKIPAARHGRVAIRSHVAMPGTM